MNRFEIVESDKGLIKAWTKGVNFESQAKDQLRNIATLDFIYKWIAVMPDVHLGMGATVGSVIPTVNAVIPAAVGVDIGCGMMAIKTSLTSHDLPESLSELRSNIEKAVPVGFGSNQKSDSEIDNSWAKLHKGYDYIIDKHPALAHKKGMLQLGSLGGGNHFIEVCLDENDSVWIMLHSGSRGVGNQIGRHFITEAKNQMEKWHIDLPDKNLAYLPSGTNYFEDYMFSVKWAQEFARENREIMMKRVIKELRKLRDFELVDQAINCHHNYISQENHYGKNVYVTRKGAVRARKGDLGIIPGSMGARSFIVEGLGNDESFHSCSHGAGRVMSRTEAKKEISLDEHIKATEGVECRKDIDVIDESPRAYKDIDKVMEAQSDLVRIKYTLKQIMCVKG